MVHKSLSGPDFAEWYVRGLPWRSKLRDKGCLWCVLGSWSWSNARRCWSCDLRCGMGMDVVGVYARVEGWVLVFLGGSKREMVRMRRRQVLYWCVVRGIGRLVLGGCKIARKGEVEFGGSRSWVGNGMLETGMIGDSGAVGGIGGGLSRWHHLRTSLTLAITVSSVDFLEEVKASKNFQSNGYELTIKDKGDTYLGMDIKFTPSAVSISMPGYIDKMLQRFRPSYLLPSHRPSHAPGKYTIPVFRRIQHVEIDDSPMLSPSQTKELQAIVGTLLYYARAVDPTLLPIANELAWQQATPTTKALTAANRALSYCAGHMTNSITYNACDMILFGHVDASYLLSRSDCE